MNGRSGFGDIRHHNYAQGSMRKVIKRTYKIPRGTKSNLNKAQEVTHFCLAVLVGLNPILDYLSK